MFWYANEVSRSRRAASITPSHVTCKCGIDLINVVNVLSSHVKSRVHALVKDLNAISAQS